MRAPRSDEPCFRPVVGGSSLFSSRLVSQTQATRRKAARDETRRGRPILKPQRSSLAFPLVRRLANAHLSTNRPTKHCTQTQAHTTGYSRHHTVPPAVEKREDARTRTHPSTNPRPPAARCGAVHLHLRTHARSTRACLVITVADGAVLSVTAERRRVGESGARSEARRGEARRGAEACEARRRKTARRGTAECSTTLRRRETKARQGGADRALQPWRWEAAREDGGALRKGAGGGAKLTRAT